MITNRYRLGVVEAFHVSDDLGQDTTEPVADGDDASAIKLRRFNVQQVVDATIRSSRTAREGSGFVRSLLLF
jgi:hypothetical protein